MTTGIVSVRPSTTLHEVQQTLESCDISAVPVIDEAGAIVGIVSTRDLLREARVDLDERNAEFLVSLGAAPQARDVMHQGAFTIDEAAPLAQAANHMLVENVHRLVVTRKGAPVGILSTRDAMRRVIANQDATPLRQFMTEKVATIDVGLPTMEAVRALDTSNLRGLVVVDDGWPVGVFTHTEATRVRQMPRVLRELPVERVMSYETICLNVKTPAYRVANYARKLAVRRILAVENRDLVGIATGIDLLRLLVARGP